MTLGQRRINDRSDEQTFGTTESIFFHVHDSARLDDVLDVNGAVCVRSNHFSLVELPVLFVVRFVRKQVSCTDRLFSVSKKRFFFKFLILVHGPVWK